MNLEILWNNKLHYVEAGNYYQGCMKVLQDFTMNSTLAEISKLDHTFIVTNLANMDNCEIGLDLIVAIQNESNNYEPDLESDDELDPNCD